MQLTKKIAVSLASVAMFVNTTAPVLAGEINLEISGNGADSANTTQVTNNNNTVVSQTNSSNITNNVNANSNTGGNDANKNTGGNVSVDTGNASSLVGITNTANTNAAEVTNCNCEQDAEVKISGNGADSDNYAKLNLGGTTHVAQGNYSAVVNSVNTDAKTGNNDANRNTGGDVEVMTGNALTHVELETTANSNWARVGGNGGNAGNGANLWITGNGADSDNDVYLNLGHDVLLQQYNSSYVNNDVDADANTGKNDANANTGGMVSVDTGNAHAGVAIDNAANFNWADVDCDCITGVTAKISGNGYDTDNKIKAFLGNDLNVFQENGCGYESAFWWYNNCGIDNNVDAYAGTGYNDADANTVYNGEDPEVTTGDADSLVSVENAGNSNVYGAAPSGTPLPGNTGNSVNVNVTFSLSQLLAALGMH